MGLSGVNMAFPDKATTNKSQPHSNFLDLNACNLTEFPQILCIQDELNVLGLSYNRIHGAIIQWLVNITRESLHLSQNLLTGFEQPVEFLPWEPMMPPRIKWQEPLLSLFVMHVWITSMYLTTTWVVRFLTASMNLNLQGNNFHGNIPCSYPKSCKLKVITSAKISQKVVFLDPWSIVLC